MYRVLFVCSGNTCRSPMAEALFRSEIARNKPACAVSVSSAGLSAIPGDKASRQVRQLMQAKGLDLEGHRAVDLDGEALAAADLVLVMSAGHLHLILNRYPSAGYKTFLLKKYACPDDSAGDIPDPFGGSMETYSQALEEIHVCVQNTIKRMQKELKGTDENCSGQ